MDWSLRDQILTIYTEVMLRKISWRLSWSKILKLAVLYKTFFQKWNIFQLNTQSQKHQNHSSPQQLKDMRLKIELKLNEIIFPKQSHAPTLNFHCDWYKQD